MASLALRVYALDRPRFEPYHLPSFANSTSLHQLDSPAPDIVSSYLPFAPSFGLSSMLFPKKIPIPNDNSPLQGPANPFYYGDTITLLFVAINTSDIACEDARLSINFAHKDLFLLDEVICIKTIPANNYVSYSRSLSLASILPCNPSQYTPHDAPLTFRTSLEYTSSTVKREGFAKQFYAQFPIVAGKAVPCPDVRLSLQTASLPSSNMNLSVFRPPGQTGPASAATPTPLRATLQAHDLLSSDAGGSKLAASINSHSYLVADREALSMTLPYGAQKSGVVVRTKMCSTLGTNVFSASPLSSAASPSFSLGDMSRVAIRCEPSNVEVAPGEEFSLTFLVSAGQSGALKRVRFGTDAAMNAGSLVVLAPLSRTLESSIAELEAGDWAVSLPVTLVCTRRGIHTLQQAFIECAGLKQQLSHTVQIVCR